MKSQNMPSECVPVPDTLSLRMLLNILIDRIPKQKQYCSIAMTSPICERCDLQPSHGSRPLIHNQGVPLEAEMSEIVLKRKLYIYVDNDGGQFSPFPYHAEKSLSSGSGKIGTPETTGWYHWMSIECCFLTRCRTPFDAIDCLLVETLPRHLYSSAPHPGWVHR